MIGSISLIAIPSFTSLRMMPCVHDDALALKALSFCSLRYSRRLLLLLSSFATFVRNYWQRVTLARGEQISPFTMQCPKPRHALHVTVGAPVSLGFRSSLLRILLRLNGCCHLCYCSFNTYHLKAVFFQVQHG